MGKVGKGARGQKRELDRQKAKARKAAIQAAEAHNAQFQHFNPPPLSGARLKAVLDSGLAKFVGPGQLTIDDPAAAWEIDPWLWTLGDPAALAEQQRLLGPHAPQLIFVCKDYQASVFDVPHPGFGWPKMWHLSLKRRDREPIDHDRWRILQQIKNTLVGEENEAVEMYPAESRLVDTANQYHLWVFADPNERWPFGFTERYVTSTESHGSKQRPLPENTEETPEEVFTEGMKAVLGEEKP
jgi:hypothetical protein